MLLTPTQARLICRRRSQGQFPPCLSRHIYCAAGSIVPHSHHQFLHFPFPMGQTGHSDDGRWFVFVFWRLMPTWSPVVDVMLYSTNKSFETRGRMHPSRDASRCRSIVALKQAPPPFHVCLEGGWCRALQGGFALQGSGHPSSPTLYMPERGVPLHIYPWMCTDACAVVISA